MRILSVLLVHFGGRDGASERQTALLAGHLARRGHRLLLLARRGTPLERRALEAGAPIFPLEPRYPLGPGGLLTPWSRRRARDLAARGGWDLVHVADASSLERSASILRAAAGGGLDPGRTLVSWRGPEGGGSARATPAARRHAGAGGPIHAASEGLWAALVRDGIDEDRLTVIHPGIDVKRFAADVRARSEARSELGLETDAEAVGAVAHLDRDRGLEDLIAAAAILARERPKLRLIVAGGGPRLQRLEERAARAGLAGRARFLGDRQDIARILQALDVWVFAGAGEEVFPLALIEAMAAGVPVVVRDQPGIREILENGKQGLFVPGTGAEDLARTIHRVLADPALARSIGRAGSVRVQRFHEQAMIDATENLYYRVAKVARDG